MREPIKKVYCQKCQKLVTGQKQTAGNTVNIVCPKCNQQIWSWENLNWKHVGKKE